VAPAASTARESSALGGARPLPAEAEPWGDDGGGLEAPAARPAWFGRTRATFRNSVWAPVALKLAGLVLAMMALSGVGVASLSSGANGVPVPLAGMLGADIHTAWLANKPIQEPRATAAASSNSSGSALTAGSATTAPSASGSASAAPTDAREGARSSTSAGMTEDGKVILNSASVEDLRHLPGVGAKRAEAILALRVRLGRFKQVSDLLRVKGIGARGLKKIMPHIVLDAPKPSV